MERQGNIDIKALLDRFKRKWYIFALSFLFWVMIGVLIIWYLPPKFKITSKVQADEESNSLVVENLIEDADHLVQEQKNISNEIGILKSYSLIYKALKSLDYKVFYRSHDKIIRARDLYRGDAPFQVSLDYNEYQVVNMPVEITFSSPTEFRIQAKGKHLHVYNFEKNDLQRFKVEKLEFDETLKIGDAFSSDFLKFRILRNPRVQPEIGLKYSFIINDLDQLSEEYSKRLSVTSISRDASILELKINGVLPQREIDFLDELVRLYIEQNYTRKNQIAVNTIDFIDNQLIGITDSLNSAELSLQEFRTYNEVLDLGYESRNYMDELKSLEKKNANELIKTEYYEYLINNVKRSSDLNQIVAPSVVGIQDPTLNNLINGLSELESERTALRVIANDKNPKLTILEENIRNMRESIIENVNNYRASSRISIQNNNKRINQIRAQISRIPETETILQKAQRKFEFNDNIFNYLLQKRAEAAIIKESTVPNDIVIDHAQLIGHEPVSPNRKLILAAMALISVIFSVVSVLLGTLTSTKISSKEEVKKLTHVPVLGEIAHYRSGRSNGAVPKILVNDFRRLRMKIESRDQNKFIGLSSVSIGEGKSFCALNLARTFAKTGKKTLLIDSNLDQPFLHSQLEIDNHIGLEHYLDGKYMLDQIYQTSSMKHLYVIPAKKREDRVDVFTSSRIRGLFEKLSEEFDHVIIDIPDMESSADYLVFAEEIDINLLIIRQNYSKNDLQMLNTLAVEKKNKEFFIVFNGVKK
jgi:capsular exopolysaccharide synthesis family protein